MLKKISILLSLIILLSSFSGLSVFSADLYSEIPTEGTMSKDPSRGTGMLLLQSAQQAKGAKSDYGEFFMGFCAINDVGCGEVELFGQTIATQTSEEVGYTLYLQKWNGASWTSIDDVDNIDYDVISVEDYHYRSRNTGYYYRVKAVHFVNDQGVETKATHYSNYIFIE
jgi:hypothetical protein